MVQVERVRYSDGCGNTYVLSFEEGKAMVRYEPVRPEESSSGFYSGGERFEGIVDPKVFSRVVEAAMQALEDRRSQTNVRMMGCGTLTVEAGGSKQTVFLASNSKAKRNIEELLEKIKTGKR